MLKGEDKNGREMEEENVRRPAVVLQHFVLETQRLKIQRETMSGLPRGSRVTTGKNRGYSHESTRLGHCWWLPFALASRQTNSQVN